jgi:hypothetical protein
MGFHVLAPPISAGGVDDAVDTQDIPRNLSRSRKLEHSSAKLLVDQIVLPQLRGRLLDTVALEEELRSRAPISATATISASLLSRAR